LISIAGLGGTYSGIIKSRGRVDFYLADPHFLQERDISIVFSNLQVGFPQTHCFILSPSKNLYLGSNPS